MTAKEKIKALGGATAAARSLGIPITTVHAWARVNRIPHWREPSIDAALAQLAELEDLTPPFPKAG